MRTIRTLFLFAAMLLLAACGLNVIWEYPTGINQYGSSMGDRDEVMFDGTEPATKDNRTEPDAPDAPDTPDEPDEPEQDPPAPGPDDPDDDDDHDDDHDDDEDEEEDHS